jgi:hypothetical protein
MGRKIKTSVALDETLLSWIDEMIERKRALGCLEFGVKWFLFSF